MTNRLTTLFLLLTLSITFFTPRVEAQERFQFDPDLTYDEDIQSPADFLGYELGEKFTFHYRVMDYFKYLDEVSDKINVKQYGETYEGRGLYYGVVSSRKNQNNIDEIKRENRRLSHPDSLNDTMADMLINNQPVVVWLSYNVHGNEASSSEAAMQTAYRLVAAQDSETQSMLNESVVIIDPMLNPDGRDRYVYYYKTAHNKKLNTNPYDMEHDEPWPGGRTNHYWFDLNRDWTWLVHPESRGRISTYQEWMPQVHLDLHEQGFNSNYFTMPGTTPRNNLLPGEYQKWADTFGRGVIREFDRHNINYATREAFDFFYPGYGSSYPSLMGSIGMLAEQGGHSRGGRAVETEDGYVLTLRQRIFDHYTNSIATVRTSIENRRELLNYFRNFFKENTRKTNTKAYILPNDSNNYTYEFINIMLQHGVRVEQANADFEINNAYRYWDGRASSRQFEAGDFIIKTDQPKHVFINSLMKRRMAFEDSVMYDMSSWSAPMAYGLDAAWTTNNVSVKTDLIESQLTYPSAVRNSNAGYAYVVDWQQRNAPNALSELWERGYRVRSAEKTFTKDGVTYSRGSLIVLKGRNYEKKDSIDRDMREIAEKHNVMIEGFDTGRMDQGMDLASRSSNPVKKPTVGLLVDSPFNYYTAGQIWFLMEQWSDFGISRLRTDTFKRIDISEYDVLIMPNSWGSLSTVLDSSQVNRLKEWVSGGGTLVATGNSAMFLTKNQSGLTPLKAVKSDEKTGKDKGIPAAAYTPYDARSDSTGLRRIPGSALKGHLDTTHPLAFGLTEKSYQLKLNTDAITPSISWQTVGYYSKQPAEILAAGYISEDNKAKLAGNAFAGVQPMGSGNVVFLVDNTQYRMFWVGTARLMQNAVMLMPGM